MKALETIKLRQPSFQALAATDDDDDDDAAGHPDPPPAPALRPQPGPRELHPPEEEITVPGRPPHVFQR